MFRSVSKARLATLRSIRPLLLFHSRSFASPDSGPSLNSLVNPSIERLLTEDLEKTGSEIQQKINQAKDNIQKNSLKGMGLSKRISSNVQEDQFVKMQRYDIFISKMEQLANFERRRLQRLRRISNLMSTSFVTSAKPYKEILTLFNTEISKGFDIELFEECFKRLRQVMRGKGYVDRAYNDYNLRELNISWRMQTLADQFKISLDERVRFSPYHFAQTLIHLGEFGLKDIDIIQKSFQKLNQLLDERDHGRIQLRGPNYEEEVYGSYRNLLPKHYVYDGFQDSQEFKEYLTTLLEWENDKKILVMEKDASEDVAELQNELASLLEQANRLKNVQVDIQASIDALRQQFFKLQETNDQHKFMKENKYIRLEMLELEELLVRAGYIDPDEADLGKSDSAFCERMERASKIFYDYSTSYFPELISPQYNLLIDQVEDIKKKDREQNPNLQIDLDEPHDKIQIGTLSQALQGLNKQALSFRREMQDRDYLNDFYKQHVSQLYDQRELNPYQGSNCNENPYVAMERDYLKAWKIYDDEIRKITPRLVAMIKENSHDILGQFQGFLGLSMARVEEPELRKLMAKRFIEGVQNSKQIRFKIQPLIDGLEGLALQFKVYDGQIEAAKEACKQLEVLIQRQPETKLDFDQKLHLLWSLSALELESEGNLVKDLMMDLNSLEWQRTSNELSFEQSLLMSDALVYLVRVSKVKNEEWFTQNLNEALKNIAMNPESHQDRYIENHTRWDPFKLRVLKGVGQGLTMASIEHQSILEEQLVGQTDMDLTYYNFQYPFRPDINFGYKGQRVLFSLVTSSQTMRDIGKPDGRFSFQGRILKKLSEEPIQTIGVPITSVVDYDIENHKLKVNSNYDFFRDLEEQLIENQKAWKYTIDFEKLAQFGASLARDLDKFVISKVPTQDKRRVQSVFRQLYRVFQIKHQTEKQHQRVQFQQGLDQLKFELFKLQLVFQSLPLHLIRMVDQIAGQKGFLRLLNDQRERVKLRLTRNTYEAAKVDESIDLSWIGTRQDVELPLLKEDGVKKEIEPELINQRFMWVDDYFHYKDWEDKFYAVYDSFNLLVVPRKEGDFKYFYNKGTHRRIVPKGIFPHPGYKREIFQKKYSLHVHNLQKMKNVDDLNEFNRNPLKLMVGKELERSKQLDHVTPELSYMVNLQNIKQGLKQDYSDSEILQLICLNTQFTDRLILEHLGISGFDRAEKQAAVFIPRDPRQYREFISKTYLSKDQEDPFSHFFIKESGKVERVHKVFQEYENKDYELKDKFGEGQRYKEAKERTLKTLQEKLEDMLLQNRDENEDTTSLSHQLETEVKVNYHLNSLMKSEFLNDIDPDLDNQDISDVQFLQRQRIRAETKLIKSSILFKQFHNVPLSEREQMYVKSWVRDINHNPNLNILNVRDSMLPKNFSNTNIADALSQDDFYVLNQIPEVLLKRSTHGQFALNDLVLELSHFLDDEMIARVETEIMSERIRKEWSLPADFKIIETRNKEVGQVTNELEELLWRVAGVFDQRDRDFLQRMLSINRNQDFFDKQYYDDDMRSLSNFLDQTATIDNKYSLLLEWVIRKEQEIKARVALPTKNFQKSEQELFQEMDVKLRKAREQMVVKMVNSEYFNQQEASMREYKDITTLELSQLVNAIVVRLNLFDGSYPAFMPQVVKAVMEHPNLPLTEFHKLDTFSQIFELDWKGDSDIMNKKGFMATNPIYLSPRVQSNFEAYSQFDNKSAVEMIKKACAPFVEPLTKSLLETAKMSMKREEQVSSEVEKALGINY